jgi:cytochrome c peroxidase
MFTQADITKNMKYSIFWVMGLFSLWSCNMAGEKPPVIDVDKPLFEVPANFDTPVYNFESNPMSDAGFQLGKKLFYDGRLSRDGSISCAECHNQSFAFTHHGHTVSHGIDDRIGTRNAPAVQNTAWMKSFFWDGGVFDLDLFSIAPIVNPLEMDETIPNVLQKISADENYRKMFKEAYGTEEVNLSRFLRALSQFMNALISADSKYDKFKRNEKGGEFSSDELAGLRIFEQKCSSCHSGELFSDQTYRNNGLEPFRTNPDIGRAMITERDDDKFKFKVPSLRNNGYTAPYMHDGRLFTLSEVLNHYSDGVSDTQNLDPVLKQNGRLGIPLTQTEKSQLIAFLKTLNDEEFIKDPRFLAPQ